MDGVNDAGLALSLTFGGRRQVGDGFGVPLILRYVLQTCATADEAARVLARVPTHMSYNVTAVDAKRRYATVQMAPDRPALVTNAAVATNHQSTVQMAQPCQVHFDGRTRTLSFAAPDAARRYRGPFYSRVSETAASFHSLCGWFRYAVHSGLPPEAVGDGNTLAGIIVAILP